jgi:hypothetical protein
MTQMAYTRCNEASMVIRGALCWTWFDVYREISNALRFPYYFGWNYPALDECMTDLGWLLFDHIIWIFDDWQLMFQAEDDPDQQKRVLRELLSDCADHWLAKGVPVEIYINHRSPQNAGFIESALSYAARNISPHARSWIKNNILPDA